MVESLDGEKRQEKAAGSALTDPAAGTPGTEGSRRGGEVVFVIFMTMDDLRIAGPLALRPWLERRMRSLRRGPGTVVEFHQDAMPNEDGRNL
jgi:hypothetical protein